MSTKVLLLPGWQNSGPGHWQTRWESLYGDERVLQHEWLQPLRGDWITHLEEVVQQQSEPVLLAAHSLGCHLVLAWAALSRNTHRVAGALLVAPPDLLQIDLPPQLYSWRPPVRTRLPFPATLVASSTDPFCSQAVAEQLAADCGVVFESLGASGHINADSGLGDWPEGRAWLQALARPADASFISRTEST
jgi:predicted alpha/beta hydrolase family esterase